MRTSGVTASSSAAAFLPLLLPVAAVAPTPANIGWQWSRNPLVWLSLVALVMEYLRGLAVIARFPRRPQPHAGAAALFLGGVATLAVALVSPLDRATAALLSAHMLQYILLTVPAAFLLVASQPGAVLLRGLPSRQRHAVRRWLRSAPARSVGDLLTRPLLVGVFDVSVLLVWHLPSVYAAARLHPSLATLEQASYLLAGILFWWVVRHPDTHPSVGCGRVLLCFAATSLAGVGFGIFLFGTNTLLYPLYVGRTGAWGVTPKGDQLIAGVLLGTLPDFFDVATFLVLVIGWVRAIDAREGRAEAAGATPHARERRGRGDDP